MGGRGRNVVRRGDHRIREATELLVPHPSFVAAVQPRRRHADVHPGGRWHTCRLANCVQPSGLRWRKSVGGIELSATSLELRGGSRWLRQCAGTLVQNNAGAERLFSKASNALLRSRPPPYPVRLPFDPITRWHGTMMPIGLWPLARPTARNAPGDPICRAISPYDRVSPYGIVSRASHTRR